MEGLAALAAPVLLARMGVKRRRDQQHASLAAAMIESKTSPHLVVRQGGEVLYANSAARLLCGKADPVTALSPRADARGLESLERMRLATIGQVVDSAEVVLTGEDNANEWYRLAVRPLSGSGAVRHLGAMMWSIEDVTARHVIEEVQRREHEDLIDFFDFAPVGLGTIDAEGCFRFVNQRLAEWLGQQQEALKGRLFRETLAGPPPPAVEEEGRGEVKFLVRSGDMFQAFITLAAYDDGGETCTHPSCGDARRDARARMAAGLARGRKPLSLAF
ncbi:MAG: two-component system cell cycle sensor histidine kinase and response regulator CckA [Rhodospirillaceae bacterium]|nr:MAG: two-component system cell cycle sensor histidine kinase and response regulator CckA [Rhodospirillaceae bacterium]